MFIVSLKVRHNRQKWPKSLSKDIGGAYVTCWINYKDYQGALVLSYHYCDEEGWVAETLMEVKSVNRKELKKKANKQYYAEAVKYGYSLVFYTWSKNAPDADVEYED
ncbi:MAG TPA: hypothetical protein PLN21_06880 [Gemmatales bacterium]|nr:hypothetical protein [Gemmatales bacterium]